MIEEFTQEDADLMLEDLQLYSGNISEITDLYGLNIHGDHFGGVIHTHMDAFNFSHDKIYSDEDSWAIRLTDPVESLRQGHQMISIFRFPKIHRDPDLKKRYEVANIVYSAYNNYSNVTEDSRIRDYEEFLGYDELPTYGHVLAAILKDYRSFQEDEQDRLKRERSKN